MSMTSAHRFAAIDIGTVTCRLLVADVLPDGSLEELAHGYKITNLGEDVDATGVLKPEAMERVRVAVAGFMEQISAFQPEDGSGVHLTAMATSASRDAKNASEFVSMLAGLGVELSVIPGEREAALSFRGASSSFAATAEAIMVVDVGGGSTEVVVGEAGQDPVMAHSFNIGCRRVTEKFLSEDPVSSEEMQRAKEWMTEEMTPYFQKMVESGIRPSRVVAVAGTATSVVSVFESMETYDSSRVHGYEVTREILDSVYARLSEMTLVERQQVVGLDPGRAPVICAGLGILQTVLDCANAAGFTVSESDILQGIILDSAAK